VLHPTSQRELWEVDLFSTLTHGPDWECSWDPMIAEGERPPILIATSPCSRCHSPQPHGHPKSVAQIARDGSSTQPSHVQHTLAEGILIQRPTMDAIRFMVSSATSPTIDRDLRLVADEAIPSGPTWTSHVASPTPRNLVLGEGDTRFMTTSRRGHEGPWQSALSPVTWHPSCKKCPPRYLP
jgi:hypothetical protein